MAFFLLKLAGRYCIIKEKPREVSYEVRAEIFAVNGEMLR